MNHTAVSEVEQPQSLSRLDVGMLVVLVSMAIAGVVGLISVLTADTAFGAVGSGFGVAWSIVVAGGTIAAALACLARRRFEALSLGALVAAGLAVDLLVLAIWLEIDAEAYGKLVGIAFVCSVFGLVVLGLTLACEPRDSLARYLSAGTSGASLLGALIAVVLVLRAGSDSFGPSIAAVPIGTGDENLLRILAAIVVVLAALWFAALAASRVERASQT